MDRLESEIQPYAWGSPGFISALQGHGPTTSPEAELWMGAHPKAPSRLASTGQLLDQAIAADPTGQLGAAIGFGALPYLKKILAAAEPLSIQTHPDAARAAAGFDAENAAGVPLDAPTRTYRDPNHKPELICALTPFDARCGFRPVDQTVELVDRLVPGDQRLGALRDRLAQVGSDADVLQDVLQWLLGAEPDAAADLTAAAVAASTSVHDGPWATEISWTPRFADLYPGDPGVIVALLLNHFTLEPGQALFLEAGVLHAYLKGAGVEIMANSDNVIRGGLTPKHIDTAELAAVVTTAPAEAPVQTPRGPVHTYDSPVREFALTRVVIGDETDTDGYEAAVSGPEIALVTEGSFNIRTESTSLEVGPGQSVWIPATDGSWQAEGHGTLFRTTVP